MEPKDTIPRLHQIVPHMQDQLLRLRLGASFEEIRTGYSANVARLAMQGVGRRTASRVDDKDAYGAPTADFLVEAIRLGLVEKQQVPSARRYIEQHRDRRYELTLLGRQLATLAQDDVAQFCDRLAETLYAAHPYFQALLTALKDSPIACPEVAEGEVESASDAGKGTDYWADYLASKLQAQSRSKTIDKAIVKRTIVTTVRRRFGTDPASKPSGKALTQAINDAFAVATFGARGLSFGATEIDVLKSWGSQLRLLDQSRYVSGLEGYNAIWLAADITVDGEQIAIKRRDARGHSKIVARQVVEAYQELARTGDSNLSAPYIPIFKVRADAAYRCQVTRALVDIVIQQLSEGTVSHGSARVLLHLGTTHQPISEPLYRRGGSRRYEMTVHLS